MFSDDTALVGLINQGNDVYYRREVELFVTWCDFVCDYMVIS